MAEQWEKVYDPTRVEEKWYSYWLAKGYFRAELNSPKEPFSIVIPPPNVTGSLHMGHALNNTLQDILVRFKRMKGYNCLWMPGTDHAGIATQNVVERELAKEGLDRHQLGREEFIRRVWEWKEKYGGVIINQLKKLGSSCDWSRERFTMDEGLSRAVREVFVHLYEDGLIYRGDYIINWCPRCHTALSDLEVDHQEVLTHLYHLRYPTEKGGHIVVVTTRPETMMGDTAVAVNPQDKRYKDLIGAYVILPVVARRIPVIADDYVDPAFGSGALKITPAHDPSDFEIGQRHKLDVVRVIDGEGRMTGEAGPYEGMDRFECRERIVEDFQRDGTLLKTEEYHHSVGHCYRCKTMVEPFLSKQWFVRTKPLAEPAIKAVEQGRTRIIPSTWERTYFDWMHNIRDWCISRQIWWGHRIPAWYCEACGEVIVAREEPKRCSHCNSEQLRQETDVLDTWFSSALWPFSTMGWPDDTEELKLFYPTSVLVTGFDILFFWVARMMMMGIKFMGDVPFRDVYIHALVRDMEGQKMSKTKGNVIDPLVMIEKYGTDAFRFSLAAFAAQGRDIRLSEDRIEGYRNFANKIWNAARFSAMNLQDYRDDGKNLDVSLCSAPDKWILGRLNRAIAETTRALDEYRYNEGAQVIYHFVWHELCDWYLELIKASLYHSDTSQRTITQKTLVYVLDKTLKLLHPFMPFITEEIWQRLPHDGESIMKADYPQTRPELVDVKAVQEMERIMEVITGVRNIRGEMGIPPLTQINIILIVEDAKTAAAIKDYLGFVKDLARVKEAQIAVQGERPRAAATALANGVEVFVPLEGVIEDPQREQQRLTKELTKLLADLELTQRKLANEAFLQKAPPDKVQKEREKLLEFSTLKEKLEQRLAIFRELVKGS
ncbi:MAG: valine--tRNA ligase [Deltaproteobacteria bacterium RBG_16_54_11]|jgi:valyl-tRNA synthetase|nr:MAG: valine--tRNA ligase [Deltaproteobacteria bacterium RBG_16_54_11]